jgi:hypothetical protein
MNTQDVLKKIQTPPVRHWARRTHRVLGVSSLLFVVLISLSGLILNHADALGMSRHAAGPLLLRIYGIMLPPVDSAFAAGGVLFATSAETLYANGGELAKSVDRLVGAVAIDGGIVVATGNEFFVTSSDAILIERFSTDSPGQMSKLGTESQRIIVAIQDGYFEFDPQRMSLAVPGGIMTDGINWSRPATPSDEEVEQIGTAALGQAINWERVLLDFHSGRILPTVGRYLADITALCLLYMCFTGIVLWNRRR